MSFPSPEFWSDFSASHWEKAPLLLHQPFGGLFADPAEVFAAVVRACDRFREGESVRLRLFGHQGLVVGDLDRLLPAGSDAGFPAYGQRVTRELQSPTFTFVANYLHVHDSRLWNSVRRFLAGLYAQVGLPADHADVDVFASTNALTPFGIHRDPASNFTLVLQGRKTMRLWPQESFARRPPMDAESFAAHRAHALTLEGEAGDLLYWPSGYWHVADSDGDLSVTLNVSLYLDATADAPGSPAVELVSQRARELVRRRLQAGPAAPTYPASLRHGQEDATPLPRPIVEAIQAFEELGRDGSLAKDALGVWLNRLTASGFNKVPAALPPAALLDDDEVSLDSGFPVLWHEIGGEIAISGNGRTIFWPRDRANVVGLIERLNRGDRLRVGSLVEELASTRAEASALRTLLGILSSWHCVERATAATIWPRAAEHRPAAVAAR